MRMVDGRSSHHPELEFSHLEPLNLLLQNIEEKLKDSRREASRTGRGVSVGLESRER